MGAVYRVFLASELPAIEYQSHPYLLLGPVGSHPAMAYFFDDAYQLDAYRNLARCRTTYEAEQLAVDVLEWPRGRVPRIRPDLRFLSNQFS